METKLAHKWQLTTAECYKLQAELRSHLEDSNSEDMTNVSLVAGADVSYSKGDNRLFAAVAVLSFPNLDVIEVTTASCHVSFPYIPGLLSFREGPPLIRALHAIKNVPDILIFDGQGVAHPRGLGIASHLGLLFAKPAIGCAKTRLFGDCTTPGQERGETSPITRDGEVVGMALRTKEGVAPVYVSVGHLLDLETATEITLACTRRFRLPEPTRLAHINANKARSSGVKEAKR